MILNDYTPYLPYTHLKRIELTLMSIIPVVVTRGNST